MAEKGDEVELDEVIFNEKNTVKELQLACRERGLAYTGSEKRLLSRLIAFKVDIENKFQMSIANKLFKEQQRTPLTLGQPKLPSLAEQELHFVTHWPYAPWCQACVAARARRTLRSTRQILRSIQQVRKVMGLQTEISLTGAGQHASNGLVERAVQSGHLQRSVQDYPSLGTIARNYPWSFKHASFLTDRYRVLEGTGRTSYELATGHEYRGKLVLFGEVVMYKRMIRRKGSNVFEQGIWCGKHSFNDCHIILTQEGACEARTIRRLAPEQAFNGPAMITCRGVPLAYSPQGILMKRGGQVQKYRQPTLEAEIQPEELEDIAQTVAAGLVTPAPGLQGSGQGGGEAAPMTPALPIPPAKRPMSVVVDERGAKKQDTTESPRKIASKREAEVGVEEAEESSRKEETEGVIVVEDDEMPEESSESKTRPIDHEAEGSPGGKMARLYPPHCAGAQSVEVHGDEEVSVDYIPEETNEELQFGYGGEEDGDPPEVTQEERMLSIPAMEESSNY